MDELELYKRATENIKITLEEIKRKDPFLYQNMHSIYEVIDRIPQSCFERNLYGSLPRCSIEQCIIFVRKFLRLCNKKYEKKFIDDLKNNRIVIDNESRDYCSYTVNKNKEIDYRVHIQQTGTIRDCLKLIHEYFHVLNLNKSYFRYAMTESISITAEVLFLDFLKKENQSEYDLGLISINRKYCFKNNCDYLKLLFPLYLQILTNGKIDENTYEERIKDLIKKDTFLSFLDFEIINENEQKRFSNIGIYKHCLGYIYACAFHEKGYKEKKLSITNDCLKQLKERRFAKIIDSDIIMSYPYSFIEKEFDRYMPNQYKKQKLS